jgi:hypothetical protein
MRWVAVGGFVVGLLYYFQVVREPKDIERVARFVTLDVLWLVHVARFPAAMAAADGDASLRAVMLLLVKILLALVPVAVYIARGRRWRWRVLGIAVAIAIVLMGPAYLRACPQTSHWIALVLLAAVAAVVVRYPYQGWAVVLPLTVLLAVPALVHNLADWQGEARLRERCAANDGERPTNLDGVPLGPYYCGVHLFPPDWVLVTGDIPNSRLGSWWVREVGGAFSIAGPSAAKGNAWTSCRLNGGRWMANPRSLIEVKPPTDGEEVLRSVFMPTLGMDTPDTACDETSGTVYASDLFDGRLLQFSPATDEQAHRRPDWVSERGGLMHIRKLDRRLVVLDIQNLIVYALDEARALQRMPAAIASSSLALCQRDGTVAIPDMAGRLRVFAMNAGGTYEFDWGLDLITPRHATFSDDCALIAVTSADDEHVWIVDRESRKIVKTFRIGPAIRAVVFRGPRELAVTDACTLSVLRF